MTIEYSPTHCKILIVCTSSPSQSSTTITCPQVKELAYIHHFLSKCENTTFTVASPHPTEIMFDSESFQDPENDPIVQQFLEDDSSRKCFGSPAELNSIVNDELCLKEYSAVLFPGGPGCLFDLTSPDMSTLMTRLINTVYEENEGIIATIGHGIAALTNVTSFSSTTTTTLINSKNAWLRNRTVTCNTVEEEKDMGLDESLPFHLEDRLRELGARFKKADKFESYVVVDERLITGQSRNSVKEWMESITKEIRSRHRPNY